MLDRAWQNNYTNLIVICYPFAIFKMKKDKKLFFRSEQERSIYLLLSLRWWFFCFVQVERTDQRTRLQNSFQHAAHHRTILSIYGTQTKYNSILRVRKKKKESIQAIIPAVKIKVFALHHLQSIIYFHTIDWKWNVDFSCSHMKYEGIFEKEKKKCMK